MLSEDNSSQTTFQKAANYSLKNIAVEIQQRSNLQTAIIFTHYAFDYIILWALNADILNPQTPPISFVLPFFLVRIITAIAFIITKLPLFFALNKITIAVQLFVTTRQPLYMQLISVVMQIAMSGVWILTKQQRMIHFDSRMGLRRSFSKQCIIYLELLGTNILKPQSGKEMIFLMTAKILLILLIDSTQFYYNLKTKEYFVRLDQIILLLYLATLLNDFLQITYNQYIFVSIVLLVILLFHLSNLNQDSSNLLTTPLSTLQIGNQLEVAWFFVQLKRMLSTQSAQKLQSFGFKILQEVESEKFKEKMSNAKKEGTQAERFLIDQFIIRQLKKFSEHSDLLKDLLLYMYLPDRRVYSYLDLKNLHHRRQYQRILSEKSVQFVNQSYEANRQLQQTKHRLFECSDITHRLYRELIKQRINLQRILNLGEEYLAILQTFIDGSINSMQRTPTVIKLLEKYSQICLPHYFAEKLTSQHQNLAITEQKEAQVIIGTEEQNIAKIMHLNVNYMRLASITRHASQKMTFDMIVAKEMQALLHKFMTEQSKIKLQDGQINLEFGWIFNNLGYLVSCRWRIKETFYSSQRCIELTLSPIYVDKALIVVDQTGIVVGVSQLTRYFGFSSSSSSLKLNEAILMQLLQNQKIQVEQGSHLLNYQLYAAPFSFKLAMLHNSQILFHNQKIYVIQMLKKQPVDLLKISNSSHENQGPDFQFYFNWSGKVTNFPQINVFPVQVIEESRLDINYGDNITQMRFFREIIDYKSNFERQEEHDCPSLPRQLQQNLPNIYEEQFYEKWHRKREKTPTWLKLAYFLIVVIVLSAISLLVLMLINFNQFSQLDTTNLKYFCKLYQKLEATIKLGTLTQFDLLGLPQNTTQLIKNQVATSSSLSNDLYIINPYAFSQSGGQSLLQQLNTLNLYINSFLLNTSSAAQNALNQLVLITPAFYSYIDSLMAIHSNQLSSYNRTALILVIAFSIIFGLLVTLLWVIEYRLNEQQCEIVQVLKSLDNDYLGIASNKAEKFKQIWLQQNDVANYEEDEIKPEQDKHHYSKHAISNCRLNISKPLQFIWFVIILLLVLLTKNFTEQLSTTSTQFETLITHNFKHITALHQTWTLFSFNSTQSSINHQISFTFNEEYQKMLAIRDISVSPSATLSNFYLDFWQRDGFCKYISSSDCPTLLGSGTIQGANVVLAFVSEQYDNYLNLLSNTSQIYKQPDVKKLGQVVYFYLDEMINANSNSILNDFGNITGTLWQKMVIVFVFSILATLVFLLFMVYYSHMHQTHKRYQQILMLIPFDKLKTLPAFHKFYNKRFASA